MKLNFWTSESPILTTSLTFYIPSVALRWKALDNYWKSFNMSIFFIKFEYTFLPVFTLMILAPLRDYLEFSLSINGHLPSSSHIRSSMKKSIRKTVAPSPPVNPDVLREVSEEREDHAVSTEPPAKSSKYSSDESSDEDEEDTRMLEGNVYTKGGVEVRN